MGAIRKISLLRMLTMVVIAALALSLLVNPSVRAGHLATSPAEFEEQADPQTVDGVAIRGTVARSPTAPDDFPVGVTGRATGDALGEGSRIFGVRGAANGNAVGPRTKIRAVAGAAEGNATGLGSRIEGVVGFAEGNATQQFAAVRGVLGSAEGNATVPDTAIQGVVGDSTAHTGTAFGVVGAARFTPTVPGTTGFAVGVFGIADASPGFTAGVYGQSAPSGNTQGVLGQSNSPNGIGVVGTGTNGAKAGVFNGRLDINCGGADPCVVINGNKVADLAEDMPVMGKVAAGDVVVLAIGPNYGITMASRPFDTRVAGIISSNPRIRLQNTQGKPTAPVAMVGIVQAKATAVNGPIMPGDLLTTSRIPGHLMRCPSALRCVGAIVGKALEPLGKGEKQILVMLWRQ